MSDRSRVFHVFKEDSRGFTDEFEAEKEQQQQLQQQSE